MTGGALFLSRRGITLITDIVLVFPSATLVRHSAVSLATDAAVDQAPEQGMSGVVSRGERGVGFQLVLGLLPCSPVDDRWHGNRYPLFLGAKSPAGFGVRTGPCLFAPLLWPHRFPPVEVHGSTVEFLSNHLVHDAGLPNLVSLGSGNSSLGEAPCDGPARELIFEEPSVNHADYPSLGLIDD